MEIFRNKLGMIQIRVGLCRQDQRKILPHAAEQDQRNKKRSNPMRAGNKSDRCYAHVNHFD